MRSCAVFETKSYTSFKCAGEPTYILSRNCTKDYYGAAGPCCKVDDAINYIVNERPDVFKHLKFMLHSDDDEYWRPDQVMRWLSSVHHSGINHFPIIANNEIYSRSDRHLKRGLWSWDNCKEIRVGGWYQPMMINHAALTIIGRVAAQYGLRSVCKAFDVTHDVGMGPFAWMLGLNHITIPGLGRDNMGKSTPLQSIWRKKLAVHAVKHYPDEDLCDSETLWPDSDRYNQSIVLGCGSVEKRGPFHNTTARPTHGDMYDVHDYFTRFGEEVAIFGSWVRATVTLHNPLDHIDIDSATGLATLKPSHRNLSTLHIKAILSCEGFSDDSLVATMENPSKIAPSSPDKEGFYLGDKVFKVLIPDVVNLHGYESLPHFKQHNSSSVWVPFKPSDCSPPGVRQQRGSSKKPKVSQTL